MLYKQEHDRQLKNHIWIIMWCWAIFEVFSDVVVAGILGNDLFACGCCWYQSGREEEV